MRQGWRGAALAALLVLVVPSPGASGAALPRAEISHAPETTLTAMSATIDFDATGAAPLARFSCSLDDGPWWPCVSPVRYDALAPTQHSFAVRLEGLGVDTTPALAQWTITLPEPIGPVTVGEPLPAAPPPPVVRPAPRHDRCPDADATPASASSRRLARALLCLLDAGRRTRGLPALHPDVRLRAAATRHARDMLVHRFFGHRSSNGMGLAWRTRGYATGARHWRVSEALHWGEGRRSTPRDALRELLASPPHRRVLLSRRLRDVGAGVVTFRSRSRPAATYVLNLGRRSR